MDYLQAQPIRQLFRGSYADYLEYCTEHYTHLFTENEIHEIQQEAYILHLLALPRDATAF